MSSLSTLKQSETPLNTLFFSEFNRNLLQHAIRTRFRQISGGIEIDRQSDDDLFALMRMVFINNAGDHFQNVNEQVREMNTVVMNTAVRQIKTGVMQQIAYIRDSQTMAEPLAQPINTSTHGKKIPFNDKIGV